MGRALRAGHTLDKLLADDLGAQAREHNREDERARAMTHEQIARALGMSRQAVAQIEAQALGKVRHELEARGYTLPQLLPEGQGASPPGPVLPRHMPPPPMVTRGVGGVPLRTLDLLSHMRKGR